MSAFSSGMTTLPIASRSTTTGGRSQVDEVSTKNVPVDDTCTE